MKRGRTMTRNQTNAAFCLLFLACFALPTAVEAALAKPDRIAHTPSPTKTITAAYTKPAPPEKTVVVNGSIPLEDELVAVLYEACEVEDVPLALALAVIEQESGFTPRVVSHSGCYGLMQLNPAYFPADLSPAENIRAGVGYLGELLAKHSTSLAAVTEYFWGPSSRTSSEYAKDVMERVEAWESRLEATA